MPLHARTRFPLSTFHRPSLRQGQSFLLGLGRHHVPAWLPSKLGVLDTLLAPSTSCLSLCPHKATGPTLASTVKDENPTSAQAVLCALAHPFSCRGLHQSLQGSSAMVWGSGVLAGPRAGCLHWYQLLHRDGIFAPLPSPASQGSLPPCCWVAAEGSRAALDGGQCYGKDALPHMGYLGAGQRGDFPSIPGSAWYDTGGCLAHRTRSSLPLCHT